MDRQHEIELARRLIAGDMQPFEEFVEHFRASIFQYSYLTCRQREDAEDIAQETLLKAFESFDQLREPERIRPWIFRIAKNACLMRRRKSIFAPERELSLDELMPERNGDGAHMQLQIADWSNLPDAPLLRKELGEVLADAVAELPDKYRSVILLRDMQELSTAETAEILEIGEDTVKTRLHRARLALRRKLDEKLRSEGTANAAEDGKN